MGNNHYVYAGQTSSGLSLYNRTLIVSSGGTAVVTTVDRYGSLHITGGMAMDTIVSGGYMTLTSGGTASGTIWAPCLWGLTA